MKDKKIIRWSTKLIADYLRGKNTKIDKFLKDMSINCPLMNSTFNSIPIKILTRTSTEADKPAVKFISNSEGQRIANGLKEECGLNLSQYKMRSEEERRAEKKKKSHICMSTWVLYIIKFISHWVVIQNKNGRTPQEKFLWRDIFKNVHSNTIGRKNVHQ